VDRPAADVVVVGGGCAGLSAATALAAAGVRVHVLEARPAPGGRATAFTDPATGERVDNGQHVLVGGYHETFRFLARIGTAGLVHVQPALQVDYVDRAGHGSKLRCASLPAPLHLLAGVARWRALTWRDRRAVMRIAGAVRRGAAAGQTVHGWLAACGQTPRAIEMLWEPLAVAALNEPIEAAAARPFVAVLDRMFTRDRRDAALALPRVPLDELYVSPSRAYIESRGGTVEVNAPARVRTGPPLEVAVRDSAQPARAIVLAVPWHSLCDVLVDPAGELAGVVAAAAATPASAIVTVNLWLDRPVAPGAFVGLPGRTFQWAFARDRIVGDGASHLSLTSSAANAIVERPNDALVALALSELQSAWPAARTATLRRAVAVRERRATFSVAPGLPARPGTRTGVAGLFLAGDWIDTGLPATIESAVMSGHLAAAAVLQHLAR
jgi:zeta-carotene desaturase